MKINLIPTCLPPHNPDKWECADGPDDPDMTNGDRAAEALKAVNEFRKSCGMRNEDDETVIKDLICDLLHLAHSKSIDLNQLLESAIHHFTEEAAYPESTTTPES